MKHGLKLAGMIAAIALQLPAHADEKPDGLKAECHKRSAPDRDGARSGCAKNVVPSNTEAVSGTCAMVHSASSNCTGL
ncbi:hypothetical protein HAV22_09020 [Massilia sp. TW-1]|uniref:Uncharacterized protein n=1 Tax=Telluria antibiotica TaxID=2717319 RepID=A0ABX0PAB9_9BURK|nr:hypothetical protein [Telluria antibiotica]NIA53792.1 hypothetical protein [Telluria antibiotica]